MEKDQFDGIIALKLVADKKSFTAAAEELRVSPPAISKMIAQLEKKMKVSLLTRTTRSVSLTEVGKRFLEQAGPAMDQIVMAQEDAKDFAKKPSGVLRINMPGVFYPGYLAPYVSTFIEKYPDITVEIYSDDQATDIFENGFDAGIRHSDILAKDLVAIKIFGPIKFITVAAPKYLNKMGRPKHPEELINHNCIRLRFGHSGNIYDKWEFESKGKEFQVRVHGSLIFNDSLLLGQSALRGDGVMYTVYDGVKEYLENGQLEQILSSFQTQSAGYYLYFPKKSQVQPKLRAFIDHLKKNK